MSKSEKKAALVNEIIQLTNIREEYWRYHPSNPNKIDVEKEIIAVDKAISNLEYEIEIINKPPTRMFHN